MDHPVPADIKPTSIPGGAFVPLVLDLLAPEIEVSVAEPSSRRSTCLTCGADLLELTEHRLKLHSDIRTYNKQHVAPVSGGETG